MAEIRDVILDVSRWQGRMSWGVSQSRGILAAYMKATQGSKYVDPTYAYNRAECIARGIPWSGYHFFVGNEDYHAQVINFLDQVGVRKPNGTYTIITPEVPVIDVEVKPSTMTSGAFKAALANFLRYFYQLTGIVPDVYTRKSFWDVVIGVLDSPYIGKLWVAHYNVYLNQPDIPKQWETWEIWQISADGNGLGPYYGAESRSIDLNIYRGGKAAFYAKRPYLRPNEPPVVEPPVIEPPVEEPSQGQEYTILTVKASVNVRDSIIPSKKYGVVPGVNYKASRIWFSLPIGTKLEVLEEIIDGKNTWVRVGQRQYVAKVYDDITFLV